jgi:hypothetical protein
MQAALQAMGPFVAGVAAWRVSRKGRTQITELESLLGR